MGEGGEREEGGEKGGNREGVRFCGCEYYYEGVHTTTLCTYIVWCSVCVCVCIWRFVCYIYTHTCTEESHVHQ